VFRLSQTTDLDETANVPSLTSAKRLIDAARRRGVKEKTLTRVRNAFERFEDFARAHGGDRAGLISMVSALSGGKDEQFEINTRKSLFRGQSHIWGVHARMAIRTAIYVPRPGQEPGASLERRVDDLGVVTGDVDMVRLRQSDPLVMLRWMETKRDRDRRVQPPGDAGAAGSAGDNGGAAKASGVRVDVLAEFSSNPLPQMISRPVKNGPAETDLVFPPGKTGAVTLYTTELHENIISSGEDMGFASGTFFTMPVEVTVREVLVPVGWSDPATARASVYGRRHHPEQVYEMRTADLLPQREVLEYLGAHDGVPPLSGSPQHAPAVRSVIERHGWGGLRFDVYRCRVDYPLMHSLLLAKIDMVRRPPARE
jgi:hypothetical protein